MRSITLAVIAVALLVPATSPARKPKPEPCPPGRFLAAAPLLPDGGGGVVTLGDGAAALDACGAAAVVTIRAKRRFTKVTARWPSCGAFARLRLVGRIAAPDCGLLRGTLKARKARPQKLAAVRSTCGDGLLDAGGGETCEPGVLACELDAVCELDCRCAPDGASTTSTSTTTSTTASTAAGSSTSTTTSLATSSSVPLSTSTSTSASTTSIASTTSTSPTSTTTVTSTTLPSEPGPDPASVAPPLDRSRATSFAAATAFLYDGDEPVQFNVAPGAIAPARAAVARGRVLDEAGAPLAGVLVSVARRPELGQTLSRADGGWDLAVAGGGALDLLFVKGGFLAAQRTAEVPWQDFVRLPDVVLLALDEVATPIDLAAAEPMAVARGSAVTDAAGSRRATILFPEGTAAEAVMPDGSSHPMTELTVRATEYTVGDRGPERMPGPLPVASGYTYAVELSVDEAMAEGAAMVRFDRALPFYVENFLGFPVGMAVPVGYFDRLLGAWVASENGIVIGIVGVTGELADVDVSGDGVADTGAALDDLGVTDAERARLAELYAPGATLWRVPIRHFTPWDCNWPYGPPDDAVVPDVDDPTSDPTPDEQCEASGSIIECEAQVLGEAVGVAGTPFTLHYRSDRVPGRTAGRRLVVPLSGDTVPDSLQAIRFRVEVAGQLHEQTFPAGPNQQTTFVWDGLDAYGRSVQGAQVARGAVEWLFPAVYRTPAQLVTAFNRFGPALSAVQAREEIVLARPFRVSITADDARGLGLGGWTLDVHHTYDPKARVLREGNGRRRRADAIGRVIDRVEVGGLTPDTSALAVGPDGSVYFITDPPGQPGSVRRRHPDGTVTLVAGSPTANQPRPYGDGGPAVLARLLGPLDLALGPDGSVYVVDINVIRRIGPDGIITTVAGRRNVELPSGGENCDGPLGADGVPATESRMCPQRDFLIEDDGSILVIDGGTGNGAPRIRRVGPDGIVTTVMGDGTTCRRFFNNPPCNDGQPVAAARLEFPLALARGPGGSIVFSDGNVIRRIGVDGIVTRVAGVANGQNGFTGDGGPATSARINGPSGLAVGPDGTMTFTDGQTDRVREVDPDGIIRTIAGTGQTCFAGEDCASGDGGPSAQARLRFPSTLVRGPDDAVYLMNTVPRRVRRIGAALPGFSATDIALPSEDGRGLYVFDADGRHVRTESALTGATVLRFEYDGEGRLARVVQATGSGEDVTEIERDGDGQPTAIVGPFGDRTELTVDAEGFLASIATPAGETVRLGSTPDGLLTTLVDPRADGGDPAPHTTTFGYDDEGRLVDDTSALGDAQTFARSELANGFEVTRTSAETLDTTIRVARLVSGIERRTVIAPDGTMAQSDRAVDGGTVTVTMPDGSVAEHVAAPDPRFDMAAPTTARRALVLPSGLESELTATRAVTLDDPADPTSLATLADEITLAGALTSVVFARATRTFTTTSPAGRTRSVELDDLGRPVRLAGAGIAPTTVAYDAHGRLATITTGDGPGARVITFGYDAGGRLVAATDPLQRTTGYTHDDAGRLLGIAFPDGRAVGFAYDLAGHLTSLTPPGRPAHGFEWDTRGELVGYAPPVLAGSGPTTYDVDGDGRLAAVVRPGEVLALAYDAGGRLATQTLARGGLEVAAYTRTYDAAGRLETVTAPAGVALAYEYDGPFVTSRTWSGPVAGTVTRGYDATLRPVSEGVGGDEIDFAYDPDGFLTAAGDLAVTRDAATGLPTASALGVVGDVWTYDAFGSPATYESRANDVAHYAAGYTRDALGRLTAMTETTAGVTREYAYVYDAADRLAEVHRDGMLIEEYAYDANGNRLEADAAGPSVTATYDLHDRLVTRGSASFTYDGSGRLAEVSDGGDTTAYAWDAFGQLAGVVLPDGRAIEYLVDGGGRRVGKRVDGVLVQGFLWADALRPVAELDGAGNVVARFVYADGTVPAYMLKDGVAYRLVADATGSIRLVVDAETGTIAQRLDYDAFGNVTGDTNPGFQPFGFAGGLYDRDTGLVHLGVRDYDPETGRWTTPDPIRFAGGDPNLYAYAGNDPLNGADPTGLFDWNSFFAGAALGAVQAVVGLGDLIAPGAARSIGQIIDAVRSIVDLANGTTTEGDTFDLVLDALDLEALVDRGSGEFFGGQICGALTAGALTGGGGAGRGAAAGAEGALAGAAARGLARGPRPPGLTVTTVREAEEGIARIIDNEAAALERAAASQAGRAAQEGGLELVQGAGNLQRPIRPLGAGRR